MFAGTHDSGVFLSTNDGTNWTPVNNGLTWLDVSGLGSSNGVIYAGTFGYGVFRSTNYGANWTYIGLTDKHIMGFAFPSANVIIVGCCESIWKSTDNGINWVNAGTGVSLGCENTFLLTYGTNVFVTSCGNVYLSTNSGENWIQKNQGLGETISNELVIEGNYIYTGSLDNSVWKRQLSEIISVQNISWEVPTTFSLKQNYPNPFNSMSKIQIQVASNRYVKLVVFDITGKAVATLVNEYLQPGTYEVTFDAGDLPSGIYFYQMRADNFLETKKLIIIK
jgi:hypothetical protein